MNTASFFSWLVAAFVLGILLLLSYETWALFTGHPPISDLVRPAVHAFPGWAFLLVLMLGLVVGHFLWGPAHGPTSPEHHRRRRTA
jgi:hypothetical protein